MARLPRGLRGAADAQAPGGETREPTSGADEGARTESSGERAAVARLEAANRSLASQNTLLKQLVAIYDRMTSLVLQGADIGAITVLLAEVINRPVKVFDPSLQPLASAVPDALAGETVAVSAARLRWSADDPQLAQVLANLVEGRRPLRIPPMPSWDVESSMVIAPIVAGDDILGYLTIFEPTDLPDAGNPDLLAVQQAATVYALTLTRQRLSADVANRLREDLIEGLLLGQLADEQETEHRARLLGYDRRCAYRVLSVRPEGAELAAPAGSVETPAALALRRRVLEAVVEQSGRLAREAIAVARRDEAVILQPESVPAGGGTPSMPAQQLAAALSERVRHPFPSIHLTVGISGPCADVTQLPRAYEQARRTVAAARQFGRRGLVTTFEDLGIYRLLFQVPDASELRSFAQQTLGALLVYDRRHEADLVRTLAAYLRHHGSLQSAARELVVHVNTVSYRLQRIQEIAGLNLDDAEDRLTAQVALKILEGLETG